METKVIANPTKVATKWALIYTATAIVITYATEFLNVDPNSSVKYISYIPFIAFLCLTQKEYRDELGGYITYGNAFSAGFRYALFSGLLLAVFTYLYFAILSPAMWEKIIEVTQTQMEDQNAPSAQIEKTMGIMRKWGPLMGAFGAAVMYAIFGAIVSLITAAIFKKERSPYDIAMEAEDPTTSDPTE